MQYEYSVNALRGNHPPGKENIEFDGPDELLAIVKAAVAEMQKRGPLCCMSGEVYDGKVRVYRCFEYAPETVFWFGWAASKEGLVTLTQLPPQTLEEEVVQKAATLSPYDAVMHEKIIDEERGVAFFILFEILEKDPLGVPGPRGHQDRYTLYRLHRGEKPEILFSDHAWTGFPGYPGRVCTIGDLSLVEGGVKVVHFTTPTYSDTPQQKEELTFNT